MLLPFVPQALPELLLTLVGCWPPPAARRASYLSSRMLIRLPIVPLLALRFVLRPWLSLVRWLCVVS
jgi:hypothetical protein